MTGTVKGTKNMGNSKVNLVENLIDPEVAAALAAAAAPQGNIGNEAGTTPSHDDEDDADEGKGKSGYDFPRETPVREMTDAQRAEYWRYHSRKHESRADSRSDYEQIKAERDALRAQSSTQTAATAQATNSKDGKSEVDVDQRIADALAQRDRENNLVRARERLELELRGRIDSDPLTLLLDGLDYTKFLSDTGDLATDKVANFAASIPAPTAQSGGGSSHQGHRKNPGHTGVDAGAQMFAERHNK